MSTPGPCPSTTELEALLLGQLPLARAAAVQRHIDWCESCPARVDGLKLESRLMKFLADKPAAEPEDVPPGLLGLMDRLERMLPGRVDDTVGDSAAIGRPLEDGTPFLLPPQGAGELGRLAGYRVIRLLGRGGMGFVFEAEDTLLVRPVGLKVLHPRAGRAPGARDRFLREARAMAAVKHDHIAVVHQVGLFTAPVGNEVPYLAMELLDGESLHAWMRANRRPPVSWVVRIGRQVAGGLAAAHAAGLTHRDVKPSNLWLEVPPRWKDDPADDRPAFGSVARVKIIDFGLAASSNLDPADHDGIGGTPAYMAPEQFRGGPIDGRVDLFALGCVLYELATGEHPFPGRGTVPTTGTGDPPPAPAHDLNPAVPAKFSDLIGRLLADSPNDRPPSARAVERELEALEAELAAARRPRRWARTGFVAAGFLILVLGVGAIAYETWGTTWGTGQSRGVHVQAVPPDRPPFPAGPPDQWWCKELGELPSKQQFTAVARKIAELNPGYDSQHASGWVEDEGVIRFRMISDAVQDVRPVRGLADMRTFGLSGTAPGRGKFENLEPLRGLRLHTVILTNNPNLTDLTPLQGQHITRLELSDTGVSSLEAIDGTLLEELFIDHTRITDLDPIRTMPKLRLLAITGTPVGSLEPLADSPIKQLWADVRPDRDGELVRRMPKLTHINDKPVKEFWQPAAPVVR
ncbi:protein kinase domain-containing protein [Fimbriiglobus ruber]|uniref:Serine/threonine-protein kinase pkn3 n=1 Tax=Fimbriiglobus ruber TaxID=1908690 RepID=A0A225E6F1_9BACT|nr:protein kinase [Fimbriiglobus ruber]OWK46388.1 Serine/threonine-protein kinase pkn3 [Fimbriiglobus ruber]